MGKPWPSRRLTIPVRTQLTDPLRVDGPHGVDMIRGGSCDHCVGVQHEPAGCERQFIDAGHSIVDGHLGADPARPRLRSVR